MLTKQLDRIMDTTISWVKKNKYTVMFIVAFSLALKVFSTLPYLNLFFLDHFFLYGPILATVILVLNINPKVYVLLASVMLLTTFLPLMVGQPTIGEIIANYAYVVLLATVIKKTIEL